MLKTYLQIPARMLPLFLLFTLFNLLGMPTESRAMRFSHQLHEKEEIRECTTCHLGRAVSIIPERSVCLPCHSEEYLADTPLGPTKTHTPLWVREHGEESEKTGAQCRSCHTLSFCVDCHQGGELDPELKKRSIRTDSVPRSHTSRFRIVHPLKATGGRVNDCLFCHTEEYCSDCHDYYESRFQGRLKNDSHRRNWTAIEAGSGAPMHGDFTLDQCQDCHPDGALSSQEWSSAHSREARRELQSCQSCHPNGDACIPCHSAKEGLMISPHPNNWRSIQSKFRKEAPEVCRKCHFEY